MKLNMKFSPQVQTYCNHVCVQVRNYRFSRTPHKFPLNSLLSTTLVTGGPHVSMVLSQLLADPAAALAANPEWTRYAFMFPIGMVVATCAQTAGIGGAAIMGPFFVLGFPLLGPEFPLRSVAASVATAILTEAFGFSSGEQKTILSG